MRNYPTAGRGRKDTLSWGATRCENSGVCCRDRKHCQSVSIRWQRSRLFSEVTGRAAFISNHIPPSSPPGAGSRTAIRRPGGAISPPIPRWGACRGRAVCRLCLTSPGREGRTTPRPLTSPLLEGATTFPLRLKVGAQLLRCFGCRIQTLDKGLDVRTKQRGCRNRKIQNLSLGLLSQRRQPQPQMTTSYLGSAHRTSPVYGEGLRHAEEHRH